MHNPAKARIYQPAKNAMQSGRARTKFWYLTYEPAEKKADPLMGWVGSNDTRQQLRLKFDTKAEAIDFAEREGIPYVVEEPHKRAHKPKSYAANFSFNKVETYHP